MTDQKEIRAKLAFDGARGCVNDLGVFSHDQQKCLWEMIDDLEEAVCTLLDVKLPEPTE